MTNKKFLLKILALVVVVCMLCTVFVACGPKTGDEPGKTTTTTTPGPGPDDDNDDSQVAIDALTAIFEGAKESVANGDMTDLQVSASLGIKTTVGQSVNNYSINFDLGLALIEKEPVAGQGNTYLNAEIKSGNDVVLGLYYEDDKAMENQGDDAMSGNSLYVQYKNGNTMEKLALNVPYINGTMAALDAFVYFDDIDLQDEDVWDTVTGYADMIGGLGLFSAATCDEDAASLTLNLGELLAPTGTLGGMIAGLADVNSYLELLNLDATLADVIGMIPSISLTIGAEFDDGALTGITLALDLTDMDDIEIKTVEPEKTIIFVGIGPEAASVELSLDYAVGSSINTFSKGTGYTPANLLNVDAGVDVELSADIVLSIAGFDISVPAGKYALHFGVDADPTRVLPALFEYELASAAGDFNADETYYTAVNAAKNFFAKVESPVAADFDDYYVRISKFDFSETAGIINAVVTILKCVDSADISLINVETDEALVLVQVVNDDGDLLANLHVGVLGEPITTEGEFLGIDAVLNLVTALFDGEEEDAGMSTEDILAMVGGYLAKLYIGINDGHGAVNVVVDPISIDIDETTTLTLSGSFHTSSGLVLSVAGLDTITMDGNPLGLPEALTITINNGYFSLFGFEGVTAEV